MLLAVLIYLFVSYSLTLYYLLQVVTQEEKLWAILIIWVVIGPFMVPMVLFGLLSRLIGV